MHIFAHARVLLDRERLTAEVVSRKVGGQRTHAGLPLRPTGHKTNLWNRPRHRLFLREWTKKARNKDEGDLAKQGKPSERMKKDTGSGLKKLADHRALRAAVLVAVLLLAAYTSFFRLGDEDWRTDEQTYQKAGLAYVRDGNFNPNQEHPFLAKYILGLTQVLSGSSEAGVVRIPAATATLLTGLVLFAFARRVAEGGSWWFAGFCGVAVGLATASKLVGILFLPAILVVGLLKIGLGRRLVFGGMVLSLAALATVLITYAPAWSEAPSAIQYMFEFQSEHNVEGHWVEINGLTYKFSPWWAYLWWQWDFYGTLASLSLAVTVLIALLRRRALELYLLVAALVPFLVLSFYVQVKLSHYFGAWQPPLILLLAIVAGKLAQQGIPRGIFAVLL